MSGERGDWSVANRAKPTYNPEKRFESSGDRNKRRSLPDFRKPI